MRTRIVPATRSVALRTPYLLLLSAACALGSGCGDKLTGPSPKLQPKEGSALVVEPSVVCNEQLTTQVTVHGSGFSPLPIDVPASPRIELPTVTLARSATLDGSPNTEVELIYGGDPKGGPNASLLSWKSQQELLVTINQIQPILVRFAVPASNLGAIQKYRAQRIAVMAEAVGGGPSSEGTLAFVDNAVDTATGTVLLKATFPNTDGALWPGAFVNVRLRLYVDKNALVVPAAAVVSGQQGSFVFVIQPDSSAATRSVKVDRTAGDLAIVSGEVRAGDRVVVDGQLRLRQGIKVQVKASGDSAQARAS